MLLGRWEYATPAPARRPETVPPPALATGLAVAFVIDSVAGSTFFGRMGRWFMGDVGIAPSLFGRITGRIDSASVTMTIPYTRSGLEAITVVGRLVAPDSIAIASAMRGSEPGPFASGRGAYLIRTARGAPLTGKP